MLVLHSDGQAHRHWKHMSVTLLTSKLKRAVADISAEMPTDRQIPGARFHPLEYGYVWCVLCRAGENDLNSNASSGPQPRFAGDARILKSVGGDAGDERHDRADHLGEWRLV